MNDGTYYCAITGAECVQSKSGNSQIEMKFQATHVQVGSEWQELLSPETKSMFMALTDAAYPYTSQKLEILKFNGDFNNIQFEVEAIALKLSHQDYEGRSMERWELAEWFGGAREPAPEDEISKLNARWNTEHVQKPTAPTPAAPAAPSA